MNQNLHTSIMKTSASPMAGWILLITWDINMHNPSFHFFKCGAQGCCNLAISRRKLNQLFTRLRSDFFRWDILQVPWLRPKIIRSGYLTNNQAMLWRNCHETHNTFIGRDVLYGHLQDISCMHCQMNYIMDRICYNVLKWRYPKGTN